MWHFDNVLIWYENIFSQYNLEKELNRKFAILCHVHNEYYGVIMQKQAILLVFSNLRYTILSISIFAGLLISLSFLSEFIFTSPRLIFYVPSYAIPNFLLIIIVAALSGLVISMSIFRIRMMRSGIKSGSGFIGSIIGASAGACSCGSIGFAVVSAFGAVGGTLTAFLTNYEIPLRLVSIGILIYTYYVTAKGLTAECKIQK